MDADKVLLLLHNVMTSNCKPTDKVNKTFDCKYAWFEWNQQVEKIKNLVNATQTMNNLMTGT